MDLFNRTLMYHLGNDSDHGIRGAQIADLQYTIPQWQRKGYHAPNYKDDFSKILLGKYGTNGYVEEATKELYVGRYNSDTISRLIKESGSSIKESDIISKIHNVDSECNLRNTTAVSLPNLKRVYGALTLDTSSPLESLGGLRYAGKINVFAKNLGDMDDYLKKLGILSADGKKIIPHVFDDIYFIMKNYL